jgi:hypothetical protein
MSIGKNLPSMFLIPLLWFFFPAKPKEQVEDDSGTVFHQSEDEGV